MKPQVLCVAAMLLALGLALVPVEPTLAQQGGPKLSFHRDQGFGMGEQIQGLFTISVTGVENIASVSFELDGKEIGNATTPPFTFQFNTDQYPLGKHTLNAVVRTADGQTVKSNVVPLEFVSAAAGWQVVQRIIAIGFIVVALPILLVTVGPLILSRKNRRRPESKLVRDYGAAGGAICPKCHRPFALSIFSLNLVTQKIARCPYCGKWSLVSPATREALAEAEAAEHAASVPAVPELDPKEKMRQQLEKSKYQ